MAEAFGKEHKNVLKDIDRILSQVPEIFGRLNFEPSEYELKNNLGFPVKRGFGKRHDHVLRDIEQILTQVPEIFIKPNFGCVEYTDSTGRSLDGVESAIDN